MRGNKPSFGTVTLVLVVLAVLGAAARHFGTAIPPGPPNRLAVETAPFLVAAAHEGVDWRPIGPDAFSEARRLDKPLFIVIGTSRSPMGRAFDKDVFSNSEVENLLNRFFVCVRIDSDEHPEWANAYLPVRRLQIGFLQGFQIWIADPLGRVVNSILRTSPSLVADRDQFIDAMLAIKDEYVSNRGQAVGSVGALQAEDLKALAGGPSPWDENRQVEAILATADTTDGGFVVDGFHITAPQAWTFLLRSGQLAQCSASLEPVMHGHAMDVLFGGFFSRSADATWTKVEMDKSAVGVASAARLLAEYGLSGHSALATRLAESAFDGLMTTFMVNGFVMASEPAEQDDLGRNVRHSFSPRRLQELFPKSQDLDYLKRVFGLDVSKNPQMAPYLTDPTPYVQGDDQWATTASVLQSSVPTASAEGGPYLDVNGFCAARLLETARLLNDPKRKSSAGTMVDRLEAFRSQDEVTHGVNGKSKQFAGLADYLAYADAELQDYLTNGRVISLLRGSAVLKRAEFLFQGGAPGVFKSFESAGKDDPMSVAASPELEDNFRESATAQMARLLLHYGRLLQGSPDTDKVSTQMLYAADSCLSMYGAAIEAGGPLSAGLANAELDWTNPEFAIAVGPASQSLADELVRLRPGRLVGAALGPVWTSLQKQEPGLYVIRLGSVSGPYTVAEAAEQIPPTFTASMQSAPRG